MQERGEAEEEAGRGGEVGFVEIRSEVPGVVVRGQGERGTGGQGE